MNISEMLFYILVFPGLLFLLAWTFFVFYFSRKTLAYIHKRVGPYFNGPGGSLQTIWDVFKLLTKESITPKSADPYLFNIIPIITPLVAALPVILIPWTPLINHGHAILDTDYGVLGLVVLIGVEPFLLFLTGFGSNNKYSFLGGMRILAQMISMEAPFFLAALSPALLFGTMNLYEIMHSNTWLTTLILLPGAIIYIIAMLGILEQPPFHIPDAEQEIVYGFYTEYAGTNYTLLKFAEFTEILVVSASAVVLFFGGYRGLFFDSFIWLFIKIALLAVVMVAIRASNPRLRLDQMLKFCWSYLAPMAVLNLVWVTFARIYILGA
ncbi:NADH-quinone oxidoreductase subunit H [Caminibacter mediatlanticus TB-2]|uniref:NADH-quinone oxidoreductase subunit H n=1 Tax=Caminibacter mediatlanticus TB-2 TaxID=391592 RepID=A0ABX5V7C2_9BACT|nr:complex I subunit 1 family protein [Caminibacter mediatlanticus]QCT94158.1 NADH-quinone oxidoreductase subunit H [Caminibacter mediatlanticus TB-2]